MVGVSFYTLPPLLKSPSQAHKRWPTRKRHSPAPGANPPDSAPKHPVSPANPPVFPTKSAHSPVETSRSRLQTPRFVIKSARFGPDVISPRLRILPFQPPNLPFCPQIRLICPRFSRIRRLFSRIRGRSGRPPPPKNLKSPEKPSFHAQIELLYNFHNLLHPAHAARRPSPRHPHRLSASL